MVAGPPRRVAICRRAFCPCARDRTDAFRDGALATFAGELPDQLTLEVGDAGDAGDREQPALRAGCIRSKSCFADMVTLEI